MDINNLTQQQMKSAVMTMASKDIDTFGQYLFQRHLSKKTPAFHKDIYRLYQNESLKRIAIAAPRSHAKSTITDLVYLSWAIVHKKVKFVLLVSDTYSQSVLFLETLKAEFEANERLIDMYGDMTSDKWAEGEIIVNGIMIKAIGAGNKVRGLKFRESRPDLIICDDLENDEMVESLERREKLERWLNGALVPSLADGGRVVVIGTILHYASLLCKMLREDNYKEYEKRTYRVIMKGDPLWKEHMNMEKIDKLRQEFIAKGLGFQFYREYMNDPVSDENQKFKPDMLLFYKEEDLKGKMLSTYIMVDRAYSIEKTADFTGMVVVSVDMDNNWYVRKAERFKGNEKQVIDRLFDLDSFYKPTKFGIEQKAYKYTLKGNLDDEMRRRNQFFKIDEIKDLGKNKNVRIEGLIPRYVSGSIYFLEDQLHMREELERFPRAEHDDLIDALAYGEGFIEAPMNRENQNQDIKSLEELSYNEWE